jgi:hypothetical protein
MRRKKEQISKSFVSEDGIATMDLAPIDDVSLHADRIISTQVVYPQDGGHFIIGLSESGALYHIDITTQKWKLSVESPIYANYKGEQIDL